MQERSGALGREIADELEGVGEPLVVKAGTDLLKLDPPAYVFLRDGLFRFQLSGKLARFYNAGDFMLTGRAAELEACQLVSSVAAKLTHFDRTALMPLLRADGALFDKWLELLEVEERILQVLCAALAGEDVQPEVAFANYDPGQPILREGERSPKIYELLGGSAVVSVRGVTVGEIKEGELFGEMSFLTGEPCAATVTASESSLVQGIPTQDFERMVQCRPRLMIELARTLAARVSELNHRLTQPAR